MPLPYLCLYLYLCLRSPRWSPSKVLGGGFHEFEEKAVLGYGWNRGPNRSVLSRQPILVAVIFQFLLVGSS